MVFVCCVCVSAALHTHLSLSCVCLCVCVLVLTVVLCCVSVYILGCDSNLPASPPAELRHVALLMRFKGVSALLVCGAMCVVVSA